MSKTTLSKEIQKELERLNDRIDRKIIKGQSFKEDARRHRELRATLARMHEDTAPMARKVRRMRAVKSPVHTSLAGGAIRRLLGFGFA